MARGFLTALPWPIWAKPLRTHGLRTRSRFGFISPLKVPAQSDARGSEDIEVLVHGLKFNRKGPVPCVYDLWVSNYAFEERTPN